jgi:hypothetical protein
MAFDRISSNQIIFDIKKNNWRNGNIIHVKLETVSSSMAIYNAHCIVHQRMY